MIGRGEIDERGERRACMTSGCREACDDRREAFEDARE